MSTGATHWAWKQQGLLPSVKLVLLSMADRADETACCWPSYARLALDTGLERKSVMRAMKALRDAGLIEPAGETRGKTNSVPVYKLNVGAQREDISRSQRVPGPKEDQVPKRTSSRSQRGPTKQVPNGTTEPISKEPTNEPNNFVDFWSLYPRKVGNKPGAQRLWSKLSADEREAVMAHLGGLPYADRDKAYIPHPSTYLNQRRWETDTEPAKPLGSAWEEQQRARQFRGGI